MLIFPSQTEPQPFFTNYCQSWSLNAPRTFLTYFALPQSGSVWKSSRQMLFIESLLLRCQWEVNPQRTAQSIMTLYDCTMSEWLSAWQAPSELSWAWKMFFDDCPSFISSVVEHTVSLGFFYLRFIHANSLVIIGNAACFGRTKQRLSLWSVP